MSLAQGSWGRTLLMVAQTAGTIVATAYGGPWAGVAVSAAHAAFWALYDTMNTEDTVNRQQSLVDLTLQTSTLGQMMPMLFGEVGNVAGNVFWSTKKVPHEHRHEQGGKGGGPTQTTISLTYSMSLAVGLCDTRIPGPLDHIVRAYRNSVLVYDHAQGVDGTGAILGWEIDTPGEDYAVGDMGWIGPAIDVDEEEWGDGNVTYRVTEASVTGAIVAIELLSLGTGYRPGVAPVHRHGDPDIGGEGNHAKIRVLTVSGATGLPEGWTLYPGTADQAVDPTMEAAEGVGNVPRYPYLAYVLMKDEDLGVGGQTYNYTFDLAQAASPGLKSVVDTLNAAVGLTESLTETSTLDTEPINMAIVSVQAVRAALQVLAKAYRFYCVESGTKLAFRHLGSGAIVARIADADCDVGEESSRGAGVQVSRVDDAQLATELDLTYLDKAEEYQSNTQRQMLAIQTAQIAAPRVENLPMVLTATQAKQIAQEELMTSWIQRTTLKTTLGMAYAALEPGDRIEVTSRALTYTVVITETSFGRPGLVDVTAYLDAAFTRNQASGPAGEGLPGRGQEVWTLTPTAGVLLNLPALTASDVSPRFHVVYSSQATTWVGAALWRSVDAEASYQQLDVGVLRGWTGWVPTATPAADWHVLDETTAIAVLLDAGELSSITDEALYNGGNLCVIGNEILAFGEAELVDTRTYHLTRLLRGRRGTEHCVSTHSPGERFVFLDTAVRAVPMTLAERGVERPWKTVTVGQTLAEVDAQLFTPTANNLNPWSVAQPDAVQDGADWVLSWRYRSRYAGDWVDGVGIGWDSDHRAFKVVVYSDGTYATVKRDTLTDGGSPFDPEALKAWTYTAAAQTSDFGAPQSVLYYRIFQVTNAGLSVAEYLLAA